MSPLIPHLDLLPEPRPAMSTPSPHNHALLAYTRAGRLAGAAHREGRFCSMCGKAWIARIGVNGVEVSGAQCPHCGTEGEP